MLIPSVIEQTPEDETSLSRRVNANSQRMKLVRFVRAKLIKKGEC